MVAQEEQLSKNSVRIIDGMSFVLKIKGDQETFGAVA
jgi:hypothetical protein